MVAIHAKNGAHWRIWLDEPEVGSGVAGGLPCTCKRKGDTWTLNGQKKWIGNANLCRPNGYLGPRP
jgi:alkylation response protein AidB-like acyl-CoA dehydrogenase